MNCWLPKMGEQINAAIVQATKGWRHCCRPINVFDGLTGSWAKDRPPKKVLQVVMRAHMDISELSCVNLLACYTWSGKIKIMRTRFKSETGGAKGKWPDKNPTAGSMHIFGI